MKEIIERLLKFVRDQPCKCRYIGEGVTIQCERCELIAALSTTEVT